jgi:hypothetical protein
MRKTTARCSALASSVLLPDYYNSKRRQSVMITVFRLILVLLCTFLGVILTLEVKTTRTFDARDFLAIEKSGELQFDDDDVNAPAPNCQPTTGIWVSNRTGELSDPVEDAGIAHTMLLTRPRPRNLRLAFLGDSVTRYQYLSLAYFLRWGRWFDPDTIKNHLVDAHSFRHPYHPDQDWNEFFLQSNRLLYPAESCDCQRSSSSQQEHEHAWAIERRYFYDPIHNNTLTYINLSGNETHNPNPSGGFSGRLNAPDIFTNFQAFAGLPSGLLNNNDNKLLSSSLPITASNRSWDYSTWGQVIRHHVAALVPKPEIAILNAGLHAHNFGDPFVRQELVSALNASNIIGIWKTTTPQKSQLVASTTTTTVTGSSNQSSLPLSLLSPATASHNADAVPRMTDRQMCQEISGCLNLSWTVHLRPDLYFDDLHFREPVYRIMNEDLLQQLNKLPAGYQMLDRSTVLV